MIAYLKHKIKQGDTRLLSISSFLYCLFGSNKLKIKGTGNKIEYKGNYLRHCKITIKGHNNLIRFEPMGCNRMENSQIFIQGNNNILLIGKRNRFMQADVRMTDDHNRITFKDQNDMWGATHISTMEGQQITFGDGCLFATHVLFRTGDSHSILDNDTGQRINPSASIHVGDRVWFCNNTTLLKGIRLGNDTIVAAGAIVTKSCAENHVILAGNPARIVKRNIRWQPERI